MTKHTAGKWKVGGKDGSIVYSALDGYAVASCAVYHGRHDDGEAEANAKLISAAPELLEALISALEAIESYAVVVDGEFGMSRTLDDLALDGELPAEIIQARAAIAKATGEE